MRPEIWWVVTYVVIRVLGEHKKLFLALLVGKHKKLVLFCCRDAQETLLWRKQM